VIRSIFRLRALLPTLGALLGSTAVADAGDAGSVTALGRIAPRDGVVHVAGPSGADVVIQELRVAEGQWVEAGATLAVLDRNAGIQAQVERLRAELDSARRELERVRSLVQRGTTSRAELDDAEIAERIARANLDAALADLELSLVKAPVAGQVLEVHARAGERAGPEGIVELGRTDEMFVVAQVYETDIGRVKPQQRARITSSVLGEPLEGVVERVALKVGKLDAVDADPVARTDARVVEVEIRLADGQRVAGLTNLQVDVEIFP
jgi:HlyD family secretion protein